VAASSCTLVAPAEAALVRFAVKLNIGPGICWLAFSRISGRIPLSRSAPMICSSEDALLKVVGLL
jgi:hypothetical protein